jgi:hypothetical protein
VHFPRNADLVGDFKYRAAPMFMDAQDKLSIGEPQEVAIQVVRETYPGIANTFTRGFVYSQAFVDRYIKDGPINTLVAPLAAKGLDFTSTHSDSTAALAWMGFEARAAILETLDQAISDKAEVRVIAYDFNLPEVVDRLEKLGGSLKIIIDDSKGHGGAGTAETEAEGRLVASAGRANVLRQHMGSLQHNKTIAVNGATMKKVVCGSYISPGLRTPRRKAVVRRRLHSRAQDQGSRAVFLTGSSLFKFEFHLIDKWARAHGAAARQGTDLLRFLPIPSPRQAK